jgi:predicted nucleic acid-binding protein
MTIKVIDASPLAALLFGEPEAAAVVGRLGDARLVAPSLLGFELANIRLLKCRRHPEQGPVLTRAFRLRGRLGVEEVAVDHEGAIEPAVETGLTAYDASYLWLSRRLGAELVTLDRQLAAAAVQ